MHIMQTKRMPGRYGRLAPERGKQPRSRTQIVLLRRKRQKSRAVKFCFIKPRSSDLNKSTALRMTTTLLNEKFLSYNRRFAELAEQTAAGLQVYGILDPADRENLTRLASHRLRRRL